MRLNLDMDALGVCSSRPLWQMGPTTFPVKYGRSVIERVLPHRAPMLLLDMLTHVDLQQGGLRAQRRIDPADPVFEGHLPGRPVYPAVLLLEMVAQAAGCLVYFRRAGVPSPVAPGLTWHEDQLLVHRACYPATVGPGDGVAVFVKLLATEPAAECFAGQVMRGADLCASVVVELGIDTWRTE